MGSGYVLSGVRTIGGIDTELWLIAVVRAACRRDGVRPPSIARADELLDERLCVGRYPTTHLRPTWRPAKRQPDRHA